MRSLESLDKKRIKNRAYMVEYRKSGRAALVPSASQEYRLANNRALAKKRGHNYSRAYKLMREYGLTVDSYHELVERQAGLCCICTRPMDPRKGTHIDHDHLTGAIRGLLCLRCNGGIGLLQDSALVVSGADAYLSASENLRR